jgi:hypothetical protein
VERGILLVLLLQLVEAEPDLTEEREVVGQHEQLARRRRSGPHVAERAEKEFASRPETGSSITTMPISKSKPVAFSDFKKYRNAMDVRSQCKAGWSPRMNVDRSLEH